ncbi:hypothetical protein POSPLADRAFT_1140189, partial [Postia placenta MAD-698-R-SB12]
ALAQGLEGDLLVLDLDWEAGARGDRARVPRGRSRCKGASGSERVLRSSDRFVARIVFWDRSGGSVRARLLLATVDDSLRTVWDVDVDKVLRVECVNLALTGSHVGWGGGREGARTTKGRGRLCTLVRAQLVCAQHADAAPGAGESERLRQRGPSCAVHCRPI